MSLRYLAQLSERIDERLFQALYSRSLVYNTCWEDTAVDRQALAIDSRDTLPAITSAGCNALGMLKPGGALGVVDFSVSSARPPAGRVRHSAWERWLWRRWFAHDGVRLDPGHIGALEAAMPQARLLELRGGVPYLPGVVTAPYYLFLGGKPAR